MATVKPIDAYSVHQIQSGQVIVDLCSVAKELVENSLDANATSIDIRFKNHGLDSIEVQDNGDGINPENYETIALKHYTSKLSSYEDLSSLQTFGFRGEALSSLCALSKFHIRTAQGKDGPKGTRLDFETSGKLRATSVVAAQKGTTVAVEDIFGNLPVRRKELEKNIKREYGKVLNLLHAYACISTEARFVVSNQMAKNKRATVFSTKSNSTTKENIANIYGAKTLQGLIQLNLSLELEPSSLPTQGIRSWRAQDDVTSRKVQILGHISRPVFGEGRQTPDRQMFFVNSRPCLLPQIAKAFNEVYRSFNISQSPFVFANIKLDTNAYDVNVSPDKRTILLHDQTTLLENLKASLTELFESHDQSVPLSQIPARNISALKTATLKHRGLREGNASIPPDRAPVKDNESDAASSHPTESTGADLWSTPNDQRDSLVERFAERNANSPVEPLPSGFPREGPSNKKESLAKSMAGHKTNRNDDLLSLRITADTAEECSEEDCVAPSAEFALEPSKADSSSELPKAVQDFNDRIASQQAKRRKLTPPEPGNPSDEDPIPSLPKGSQRASSGPVQDAFDRMRPKRKPIEEATITIGGVTKRTIIGPTSSATKRRSHYIKDSTRKSPPISSFSKNLRAFSAPGTQVEGDEGEDDSAEEDLGLSRGEIQVNRAEADSEIGTRTELRVGSVAEVEDEIFDHAQEDSDKHSANTDECEHSDLSEPAQNPTDPTEEIDDNYSNAELSTPEALSIADQVNDVSDEEYIDEDGKKVREDAKVEQLIQEAEKAAAKPTEDNLKRASQLLKGRNQRSSTLSLVRSLRSTVQRIDQQQALLSAALESLDARLHCSTPTDEDVASRSAEEHLSLSVSKSDFDQMLIIGQFNLGFIVALRPLSSSATSDELFIIDQHASDEKYNFERLQRTTVVQNQRLVHPLSLELTAIDEETILEHPGTLIRNGFLVTVDTEAEDIPMGRRTKLLGLPISREVTFTLADLEELLVLLREWHGAPTRTQDVHAAPITAFDALRRVESKSKDGVEIPRPSKVRKMFAMRACRGSIMIGRTLTHSQMQRIVRHLGGLDKPWNCPHGRPTMRHLAGLGEWRGWREGDGLRGLGEDTSTATDWLAYLRLKKGQQSKREKKMYGATGSEWMEMESSKS